MQLVKKSLTLLTGEATARVLGVVAFALLARALPLADFGTFSFALSAALIVAVVVDMGQNAHLGRLVASNDEHGSRALSRVLLNKCGLGAVAMLGAALILWVFRFSAEEITIVVLMTVWATILSMLDSARAVARARGLMSLDSAVNGFESAGRLLAIFVVWAAELGLMWYAVAFIVEALVALAVFLPILGRRVSLNLGIAETRRFRGLLGDSWLVGMSALAMAGFYRVDQVLVQGVAGASANALYGAATKVAFTATVGGTLVMMAGYPELARAAAEGKRFAGVLRSILRLSVTVGLIAAGIVYIGAEPIVAILYGQDFAAAVPLVRILSIVVLASGLTVVGVGASNALGRERRTVAVAAVMTTVNIIGNLVLLPRYGATGAAWMSSIGEVLLAFGVLSISADQILRRPKAQKETRGCS